MKEDPFGLNKLLTEAKRAKRPSEDTSTRCVGRKEEEREKEREREGEREGKGAREGGEERDLTLQ